MDMLCPLLKTEEMEFKVFDDHELTSCFSNFTKGFHHVINLQSLLAVYWLFHFPPAFRIQMFHYFNPISRNRNRKKAELYFGQRSFY